MVMEACCFQFGANMNENDMNIFEPIPHICGILGCMADVF
jgi:hypothetical protein